MKQLATDIDTAMKRMSGELKTEYGASGTGNAGKSGDTLSEKTKDVELKQISDPKQVAVKNSMYYNNDINNPNGDDPKPVGNITTNVQSKDEIAIPGNYP